MTVKDRQAARTAIPPAVRHCAIYTRKSSEEGLDQDFNSLDAQREACAAYIRSQAGEGWREVTSLYDDGGYSGGTMERPALQRLLADLEAGLIHVIVVYKIDRLTRSLADFVRMVERFDRHGVSFVSVTQAFNTTTSMGRLTLNVLLSFAQFEREVTGERIRDKIAASKAKGMWMGGNLPLGYDAPAAGSRALIVNEAEAATVRAIFAAYLELGSVHLLERQLRATGILSKQRRTQAGRTIGGVPFSRGALFHLLRNRIYLGSIVHKGIVHDGMHPAIVDADTFEAVQSRLDANVRRRAEQRTTTLQAPVTGRLFDADGNPMSPTVSRGRFGRRYRYYVSAPLQQGRTDAIRKNCVRRVAANELERAIAGILARLLPGQASEPLALPVRIEVHVQALHLLLPVAWLAVLQNRLLDGEQAMPEPDDNQLMRLVIPMHLGRSNGRTSITAAAAIPARRPDAVLIRALRAAHRMIDIDEAELPILARAPASPYDRRVVRLAFLSPDLQRAILDGRQPPKLNLERLLAQPLPISWREQESQFGFSHSTENGSR